MLAVESEARAAAGPIAVSAWPLLLPRAAPVGEATPPTAVLGCRGRAATRRPVPLETTLAAYAATPFAPSWTPPNEAAGTPKAVAVEVGSKRTAAARVVGAVAEVPLQATLTGSSTGVETWPQIALLWQSPTVGPRAHVTPFPALPDALQRSLVAVAVAAIAVSMTPFVVRRAMATGLFAAVPTEPVPTVLVVACDRPFQEGGGAKVTTDVMAAEVDGPMPFAPAASADPADEPPSCPLSGALPTRGR